VAQSFNVRAIDALSTRVAEVTRELTDSLVRTPHPDLIADFADQLAVAIIAEILDVPVDTRAHLLEWGHSGAPLCDVGIDWRTYRRAIDGLRVVDHDLREHFHQVRIGGSGDTPFSQLAAGATLTDRELTANAALMVGAGFENTVNLIGNGIVLLLQHPDQLARLREDPTCGPPPSRKSCGSTAQYR
jgi:cytochrome P450